MLDDPLIAAGPGEATVVALQIPITFRSGRPSSNRSDYSLALFRSDGAPLKPPAGDRWFLNPAAVYDAAGTLHLVWGEPDAAGGKGGIGYQQYSRSIWYSALPMDGSAWTPAELLLDTGGRTPGKLAPSITVGSDERVHVAVGDRDGVVHLVREGGDWNERRIGGVSASSVDLAAGGEGLLLLGIGGYIEARMQERMAANPGEWTPGNDAVFRRSVDGGESWEEPVRVSALGQRRASDARVFVDDSGRIHLLWGQTAPGGVFSERVRHATSADGGASWSTPHDFIFGDHTPFHWWTAAMDRCGAVHLVIRSVNEELQGFNVRYARWQGGWDDARVIFRESDLRNVTLGVRADGTAVELVGSLRVALDADPIPTYAVVAAELRIGDASH